MPKSNASCECTISQSFSLVLSRVRFRTRCLSGGSAWSWWQYPHSCARGQPVGEDRNTHGWHLRQRRCGSAGSLEPAVIAVATWVVLRGSNQLGGRTFLSSSSSASVKIELLRFLRSFWQRAHGSRFYEYSDSRLKCSLKTIECGPWTKAILCQT